MNLLYDSIFTVDTTGSRKQCNLPEIYRLLQEDEVESFTRLQSHQKQAWHCFLAQLGAIATEDHPMPETEEGWRKALLDQTSEAAWNLQTDDLSEPAFMQPPVPNDSVDDWDEIHVTESDVPVLSKNHALKKHRMSDPKPEHWVYMLVNVQTSDTYGGGSGGYPKSSRGMKGRAFLSTTPSLRLGDWVFHDISRLNTHKREVLEKYAYSASGKALLWTLPWKQPLRHDQIHPWYIDCCRRIRNANGWHITTIDVMRVREPSKGATGDPWTALNEDTEVLRPRDSTFRYDELWKLLFSERYSRPVGFWNVSDGYIVFRAMPKDYTERSSIRERVIRFTTEESVDPFSENGDTTGSAVAREAKTRVDEAGTTVSILSHALDWLLCDDIDEGPDGDSKRHRENVRPLKDNQEKAVHNRIDQRFFDRLFQAPDYDKRERRSHWQDILVDELQKQWEEAKTMCPSQNRWNRLAEAESIVDRRISSFDYATNR